MNDRKIILGVIVMVTLGITATAMLAAQSSYVAEGYIGETEKNVVGKVAPVRHVPLAISGDNIYVAWWTNKTGNDEVMFRVSTDAGKTFSDKINLSNSPNSDSVDVSLSEDEGKVAVSWWERNQTANEPVIRISTDSGKTFGQLLKLATNGTIGD